MKEYLDKLSAGISGLKQQSEKIDYAASILAGAAKYDRLIHLFGSEPESSALTASVFFQPGKPICIDPMLDPVLDPAHGSYRNAMCLKIPGIIPCILDYYEYVEKGDPIIIIGSDPTLTPFSEAIKWANEKRLSIITVSCTAVVDVGVSLETGSDSYCDGTYTAMASTLLELLSIRTASLLAEELLWEGDRFVNLERDKEKIDKMLFRVRHL